ncbi:MAG: Holliday junction branch migration protein RuvA [Candidatus Kerfeldbacteria bacterium]|nr:Holliday junction branch migration protein RuvA [Candidatus Kerfeldbacteria bacterium]
MIASLTGTVTARDERSLTLDVHGIGWRLFVGPKTLERFPVGQPATLTTHLHVREDALELYGFGGLAEQRLFEKLITVSGVGPKVAMAVLAAASVEDIEAAIERGQAGVLTKVSGVGTKTAERIIVDLKGKLASTGQNDDTTLSSVIDALQNLGYTSKEARDAATTTEAGQTVEERIRQALKRSGRTK